MDRVIFSPSPEDATRVAALKSGKVDAIYPLPSDLAGTVQSDSMLAIQRDPSIYLLSLLHGDQYSAQAAGRCARAPSDQLSY